jgi:succinoglycan biosynthesis protein ExoM
MDISVCIATYRRPDRLCLLLGDLALQRLQPGELVVVDNDPARSAEPVVAGFAAGAPFPVRYESQPVKNISLTRNRCLDLAHKEWLAFADDDERAPPEWLQLLAATARAHGADGVQAPVLRILPEEAPEWIQRGDFYSHRRFRTGEPVPPNEFFIGNFLLRAATLHGLAIRFDERLGLSGGEDGDFLARLRLAGARFVWCDEATLSEPVEAARLNLRWLRLRALRGGQDFARNNLIGRYGQRSAAWLAGFFARAAAQLAVSCCAAIALLPTGRHRAAQWYLRAWANAGKLSALWGAHHQEYA